ncbi:hypothetical protein GLP21_12335 [Photobacterium carnosum]|uniref:Uncharacterized protein n=1 Tax=Photobacterium carnosum TaxID=2023717 RepID=A0A2N4UW55_9GAMM|nr:MULTISPECIES: hypothetical protein [Photobacterium]MCD9475854.1 hypothetical protein [Photobacterium phosphoreum]MCD9485905.1 hypothetical protein [Photobacterium iliopiscarium]MCD9507716.1 hypothetical protein [Photobacterium phosphoreum]MCD9538163.1 hypothetical protein [Photobacterium carnosum]MCD9542550.1 hypothetical protein [Photobacterium carnosum]
MGSKPEFLIHIFEKDALTISILKELLNHHLVPALGDVSAVLDFTDEFITHIKNVSGVADLVINLAMIDVDAFLDFAKNDFENGHDNLDKEQALLVDNLKKKLDSIGLAHASLYIVSIDNLGIQSAMLGEYEAVCQASSIFMKKVSTIIIDSH